VVIVQLDVQLDQFKAAPVAVSAISTRGQSRQKKEPPEAILLAAPLTCQEMRFLV
jgi:hypothetical protein